MFRIKPWAMRCIRALRSNPWPRHGNVAPVIDQNKPTEEENTPDYDPRRFYPTRLGKIINDRYQIATKVGYGTNSTVWLARDLSSWKWSPERYVAIKIKAAGHPTKQPAQHELHINELITRANPQHEGWHFVRPLVDSFTLKGPYNNHLCLVFEPLREPLWLLKTRFEGGTLPSELVKIMVQMLLHGLDYLHRECHVVHTDLKPDNIMVRLEDKSILERNARDEYENPLPQKACVDRIIYLSRNNYSQPKSIPGIVSVCDFGLSVKGYGPHYGCIQAEPYRAPEVILDAGWSFSSDIWNLGVMLWDLLERSILFEAIDPLKTEYSDESHLAHITALLGPPPEELLAHGNRTSLFYTSEGEMKSATEISSDFTFAKSIRKISGEDKDLFIAFVKRMLKWRPEDRSTAKDLLKDAWLR